MAENQSLREYYKILAWVFLFGIGGSVWGGMTYYIGVPVGYLSYLKASSFQIGLITAIFWGGFAFPQIWAGYATESMQIKKKFIGWSLIISSLGFLAAGLYILMTGEGNPVLSSWMFILFYLWASMAAGLYIPAAFSLLFKVIPSTRLGQLLGIYFAMQFVGVFVSGFVIKAINNAFPLPYNYAVLFVSTFVMTVLSSLIIFSVREEPGEAVSKEASFGAYIGKLATIFREDVEFTKFVFGKWLMSGHYVMQAYLVAYLIAQRGFLGENAGWFSSLNGLGLFIGGFTITKIADKYGPKQMLITSQVVALIYTALVWFVPSMSPLVIGASFIITGLAQISDNVGYSNTTMFYCPTLDKSTYVAAVNVGIILPMIFLPMIMGKLMDMGVIGFNGTFAVAVGLMVLAIIYIGVVVKNPPAFLEMKAQNK